MIVCVSKYRTDRLDYKPGDIIADERVIAYVLNDSPASFAPYIETGRRRRDGRDGSSGTLVDRAVRRQGK